MGQALSCTDVRVDADEGTGAGDDVKPSQPLDPTGDDVKPSQPLDPTEKSPAGQDDEISPPAAKKPQASAQPGAAGRPTPAKQKKGRKQKAEGAHELYSAAKSGRTEEMLQIMDAAAGGAGEDQKQVEILVNESFEDGYTSLMTAAEAGHSEAVALLVSKRANVGARNAYGQSALHMATLHNRIGAAEALVAPLIASAADGHGQAPGYLDATFQERSALHWAAHLGHDKILATLLSARADVNQGSDRTPLMEAVLRGHSGAVQLLAPHCDPGRKDSQGQTALYMAVAAAKPPSADIVRCLAERPGTNLRETYQPPGDQAGKPATLAAIARRAGHDDIAKILSPPAQPKCQCVIA